MIIVEIDFQGSELWRKITMHTVYWRSNIHIKMQRASWDALAHYLHATDYQLQKF